MTLADAARRIGVTPDTLRRWVRRGLVPQFHGEWTPSALGAARVVARMRERGHSLAEIQRATKEGRLAFGFLEELFPTDQARISVRDAARETGLEEGLVARLLSGLGVSREHAGTVSEDELQLLRYVSAVLESGFPLVALLQLVRVYGQSMARIADAEVRLFHLYVHEPLLRAGSNGVETAEQMHALSREVLPLVGPVLDQIHQRYLMHFVEQDVVGHMESALDPDGTAVDLGRMRVAIAFADLAVGFQTMQTERPLPRIAVHCGVAMYRDGDYYGRDVNIASRMAARSAGGEVLVTRPVVDAASAPHLEFERIGEIRLKGFNDSTEVFLARQREDAEP